jgi:hypothetical protein
MFSVFLEERETEVKGECDDEVVEQLPVPAGSERASWNE